MPPDFFTFRSRIPASAEELFAWHTRPATFLRLQPPWEPVTIVAKDGPFGNGHRVTFHVSLLGPVKMPWTAKLHDVEWGRKFEDRQTRGPFAFWNHTHTMTPDGPETCVLEEHVEYRPPLGTIGRLFTNALIRQRLEQMFAYRHAVTISDLVRHRRCRDRLRVAITGSHGLVGSELTHFLTTGGHSVVRFVRGTIKPASFDDGTTSVSWNPEAPVDPRTLEGVDAVIHLAGENLGERRWNDSQKRRILESRTGPTRRLAEALAQLDRKPKVFVSASAVGVYGDRGDELLDESSAPGTGFLADVCKAWEAATQPAQDAGVRVVQLRIGVVQSPKGAALGSQLLPFQLGAGAVLGSGRPWISWITVNDLIGAIHHALITESLAGPVNAVAPHPVTNRDFGRTLATVLRRPFLMTLPRWVLRLMFGEIADAALLASIRVAPHKLLATGFQFDHATLEPALRFLLGCSESA